MISTVLAGGVILLLGVGAVLIVGSFARDLSQLADHWDVPPPDDDRDHEP